MANVNFRLEDWSILDNATLRINSNRFSEELYFNQETKEDVILNVYSGDSVKFFISLNDGFTAGKGDIVMQLNDIKTDRIFRGLNERFFEFTIGLGGSDYVLKFPTFNIKDESNVDFTNLTNKINDIELALIDLDESLYTVSSWVDLQDELVLANTMLENNPSQPEIDDMVISLDTKFNNLKLKPIDKDELINKINEYELLTESFYTETTWQDLTKQLDLANAMIENDEATQIEIDEMVIDLNEAFNNLILKPVDKESLIKKVNEYELEISELDESLYTVESWENLNDVLDEANQIILDKETTQSIVNDVYERLLISYGQLTLIPPETSTTYGVSYKFLTSKLDYRVFVIHRGEKRELTQENSKIFITVPDDQNNEFQYLIKANRGYQFETIPLEESLYNTDTSNYDTIYLSGDEYEQTLEANFKTRTTLNVTNIKLIPAPTPDVENLPYNKIYDMNEDQLQELSNYTFVQKTRLGDYGFQEEVMVDFSQYIVGLFVFPYRINLDKYELEDVLLGGINTDINTIQITDYIHDINLGSIEVNDLSTEKIGFKNISVKLFVPFFNWIELEVDEVLGATIHLQLKLNIITGKGTLNIFNDRTDSIIYTESNQIGERIPYIIGETLNVNTSDVLETAYDSPFIQIKVLKPDNDVQISGTRLIDVDNDYQYMKDDNDINLKSYATEKEQKLIEQHINNGIFVRKN